MEELYIKFNYPSIQKFKQILKANDINVKAKEVEEFVSKQSVTQLHKPVTNIKQKQKFIVCSRPFEMVQIDLLDYQKYATKNKNFKYILIAVDIFSRFAYGVSIKSKEPKNVLDAFQSLKIKPMSLFHDSGNEYKGVFLKYLNENDIVDLKADIGDHHSLGVIDRFSRTLKTMISKYMTAKDSTIYYDKLPDLIDVYNETPHSSLGDISPSSVFTNRRNYELVREINFAKMDFNQEQTNKIKMKVGDSVRVRNQKKTFTKGYEITYSKQIYKVIEIKGDRATLDDDNKYKVENLLVVNPATEDNLPTNRDVEEHDAKIQRRINKEMKQLEI